MSDYAQILHDLLDQLEQSPYIHVSDIPNIPLYMDQVTTFMDEHLTGMRRSEDEKLLTKTMINNYAKNKLLPPPEKKKYSREHMLILIYIYYFKGVLSLQDIQSLLKPLCERYFGKEHGSMLTRIYEQTMQISQEHLENLRRDVEECQQAARTAAGGSFADLPEQEQSFIELFIMVSLLSMDASVKRQIASLLIDRTL